MNWYYKTVTFLPERCDNEVLAAKCLSTLHGFNYKYERQGITAELTVVLAEIEEYQALMKRFNSLQSFIQPSYQEATKKSAKLMARLNVWTNTISLINQNIAGNKEC